MTLIQIQVLYSLGVVVLALGFTCAWYWIRLKVVQGRGVLFLYENAMKQVEGQEKELAAQEKELAAQEKELAAQEKELQYLSKELKSSQMQTIFLRVQAQHIREELAQHRPSQQAEEDGGPTMWDHLEED